MNKNQIKISIVIASYNYENLIGRAIDSVIAQTYKNWELIIIDDGSTDNSVNVIKRYQEKYENIRLFQHENVVNKGLKETIKLGVEKSSGKYIAFLESDDYWETNYLEEKIKVFEKDPDLKFIFNDVNFVGDKKSIEKAEEYFKYVKNYLNLKNGPRNLFQSLFIFNFVPTFSCVFIENNVLKHCNFETPIDALLDLWLWFQISANHKFYYIDKKLTNWMMHPNSYLNRSSNSSNKENYKLFIYKIVKLIIQEKGIKLSIIKLIIKLFIFRFFMIPKVNKLFRGAIKKILPKLFTESPV